MDQILSYLITFLIGALGGAAGNYLASKYTEQRLKQEAASELKLAFTELAASMPALIREMATDIQGDKSGWQRMFIVLRSKNTLYSLSKPHFAYYEAEHDNLEEKIAALENHGFISQLHGKGDIPRYEFEKSFIAFLKAQKT